MNAEKRDGADLKALQQLLDAYGGDPARWPAALALRLQPLLDSSSEARDLLTAARALDAVLSRAPEVSPQLRSLLADRIVSEALAAQPKSVAPLPSNVIDLATRRAAGRPPMVAGRARWQAAAVLAASLLAGVFVGVSGQIAGSFDDVASLTGLGGDGDVLTAALDQAVEGTNDEDPL